MIKLENLTKKYGDFTAVSSLNLEIKKGDIFAFLGPNGAGKTTTIKMMCGLTSITSGDVLMGGVSIKKDPIGCKKKFALIPDKPYVFEKLRGIEYVEFVADLYGIEKKTMQKRLDRYAHIFGVNSYINNFMESYSHGMSQKLLITASLVRAPEVFILDEPMTGLDPKSMKTLSLEFKKLAGEGMTIFMSTHSLDTAEEVCISAGILDKGKLAAAGSIKALKKKDKSRNLENIFFRLTGGGG
ncbi:MAG TPA: ABC transporter ATP-binding protein [Candidatus Goldiibacteriota bacterium]|nr:ABC transporter ATP-binding protein [Candidatus Goldiibacteriota bacterium]